MVPHVCSLQVWGPCLIALHSSAAFQAWQLFGFSDNISHIRLLDWCRNCYGQTLFLRFAPMHKMRVNSCLESCQQRVLMLCLPDSGHFWANHEVMVSHVCSFQVWGGPCLVGLQHFMPGSCSISLISHISLLGWCPKWTKPNCEPTQNHRSIFD